MKYRVLFYDFILARNLLPMTNRVRNYLRQAAIADLSLVVDGELGLLASGGGRFKAFFGRDAFKSIILSLSKNQGELTNLIIEAAVKSLEVAASYEGQTFNRLTEEAPGKKPHEIHTNISPQERLALLKNNGWPVFDADDGSLGLVYYGAGDSTSLFNIAVATVAKAMIAYKIRDAKAFLTLMWPHVLSGIRHDIHIADSDRDDLIESNPQNSSALLNHTWKDSSDAYIDENGNIPQGPFKYFNNNCYFVWSLRESAWIAGKLGKLRLAKKLSVQEKVSRKKLQEIFWSKSNKYFVPVVDGSGNQVDIVADDAIDGLWAKVITRRQARLVSERLQRSDMLTRWGLRTRSSDSNYFFENGASSYHNGLLWLHRNRIAAVGFENYDLNEFAKELDKRNGKLEMQVGRVECIGVARDGKTLLPYLENGVEAACNPQAWTTFGSLSRTA